MSRQGNKHVGAILIFVCGVLWGTIGLFVKELAASGSTPELISFLRVFFAFLFMAAISVMRLGWRSLRVNGRTLLACGLLGLVCHGVYNIFYSLAVTLSGVAVSAVLLNIAPVVTMLCAVRLYGEKITPRKTAAVVFDVFGCVLAATNGDLNLKDFSALGILCGAAAGICYAMTAIFGRFAADQTEPFVLSAYSYLFAALFLFVWLRPWQTAIALNSGIIVWSILFALIPTAIAYLLYYRGLQTMRETSKVPVIASVETVVAAVIGVLLYQERITAIGVIGIVLVLMSIVIMNSIAPVKKIEQADEM